MYNFQLSPDVGYTIDIKGVAIIKNGEQSYFIEYPQAAVWLLFANKPDQKIAMKQIRAVLSGYDNDLEQYVMGYLKTWKKADLII